MGKAKTIYVELDIRAGMDALWNRTQTPEMHEKWDLRFSEIRYLAKRTPDEPQRFLYATRIGFGLRIEGSGVTRGSIEEASGRRTSVLRFGSDSPLSLIREGGGFWRYIPHEDKVTFMTRYDYTTRFGPLGHLADRLVFRPLIGWATAWSFDRLRLWLESGIPPSVSFGRWLVHVCGAWLLALLWMYQGIVPKLIAPEAGELDLLRAAGWFSGWERGALAVLGLAEAGFGLLIGLRSKDRRVHAWAAAALVVLAIPALLADPDLWASPMSPIVLSGAMLGLHGTVACMSEQLPSAGRCRRRPGKDC
ncbi:hypothetical protein FE784_29045 [Paenibacillus hemerocallicola]|uniref:DoxX family protein n=1 Tax=Paenibacillus hemerocallicola TaxID=1172614 RepID=A0A5C4T104_9BACL|nr:DoxX-like family protein [Paenibacillus hemerocallicola]TNJ62694.1 hypothetical protein FE784_29045 [Paenibacillus hemerocallicola]